MPRYNNSILYWKLPPVEDAHTFDIASKDPVYGHLPRIGMRVSSEYWHVPDTGLPIGELSLPARDEFHKINRVTFRAQEPGNYEEILSAPIEAKGALPALNAILITSRANIPAPLIDILWPLTRIAVRTGQCVIEPGEGGRKVEQTGKSRRPAPDSWHAHNESTRKPDFREEIHIPEDSYVVASSLPTILADDQRLIRSESDRRKAESEGFVVHGKQVLRGFKKPYELAPYEVGMFTDETWHTSQKNEAGSAVVRCFMRVFNRVPWQALQKIAEKNSALRERIEKYLRADAPAKIAVSRELSRKMSN